MLNRSIAVAVCAGLMAVSVLLAAFSVPQKPAQRRFLLFGARFEMQAIAVKR